jgi:hypothetical protein
MYKARLRIAVNNAVRMALCIECLQELPGSIPDWDESVSVRGCGWPWLSPYSFEFTWQFVVFDSWSTGMDECYKTMEKGKPRANRPWKANTPTSPLNVHEKRTITVYTCQGNHKRDLPGGKDSNLRLPLDVFCTVSIGQKTYAVKKEYAENWKHLTLFIFL